MIPSNFLTTLRSKIDYSLSECLDSLRQRFATTGSQAIVDEVIQATLPKGGRIRPILCCLGYTAVGGEKGASDHRILKAAASLELLHSFALIHDDVMDGSPLRRGQPSIHRRLADERLAAGGADSELHGISLAILAGDLALVASDLLFAESGFAQDLLVEAYEPLSTMRMDAIAGQYLDLTHSGSAAADLELTTRIARLKTGSYSVEGPLLVGATLGEGSAQQKDVLRAYARPLGEAYQLVDDLMGLFGDPEVTGKDTENDIRRGKPTPLIARAMALASGDGRETIRSIWGNPQTSDKDLSLLRKVVRDSGAVEASDSEISRLISESNLTLDREGKGSLVPAACSLLQDLSSLVLERGGTQRSQGE